MEYYQPKGIVDPNAGYIDGDPQQGIKGSVIPAGAVEFPQREIVNCITKGGHVPSNLDIFQLTRGVRRAKFSWAVDTGSANSISIALDPPLTAYASGLEVRVMIAADNTSSATIRINGLSTQQIIKKDGSTLVPGDLKQGGIAVLVYDGANFQLVSGAAGSTTITGGWFNGADYMVDVGPANHISGTPVVTPTSYYAGQSFLVLVANTNTAATDINVAGLGVMPLVRPTGEQLGAGDIVPGMLIRVSNDGAKFSMLSGINMEIIETTVTKIVGPNAGADFADLAVAMEWAMRRKFDDNGWLLLQLQNQSTGSPLVHNYSKDVVFDHPQGDRIYILGGPMNISPPVPPNPTGNITNDLTAVLAYFRTAFRCELKFTGSFGLVIRCRIGLMQNVLVTGPGPSPPLVKGLIDLYDGGKLTIDTVASCNAAVPWWIIQNSTVTGRNFYAYGAASGSGLVILQGSSFLEINEAAIPRPGWPVVPIVPISSGNGQCQLGCSFFDGLIIEFDSTVNIAVGQNRFNIYDCSYHAIWLWGASSAHVNNLTVNYCPGGAGIIAYGSKATATGSRVFNSYWGYLALENSSIDCTTSYTSGIAFGDYQASLGGNINCPQYGNPSAQFSPTLNTEGNSNSYITG